MLDPLHELDKEIPRTTGGGTPTPPEAEATLAGSLARDAMAKRLVRRGKPSARRTPRIRALPVANVAVVFVHGMGTSRPGDMLEGYMNPSLEWIKRATTDDHNWYGNNNLDLNMIEGVNILERNRKPGPSPATSRSTVPDNAQSVVGEVDIEELPRALLHSTATTPAVFQPSYIDVDIVRNLGSTAEKKKLVAVEAWWDGEFDAPPFRLVANWALGVAPSLILRHLALVWERDPGRDEHTVSVSQMSLRPAESRFAWLQRAPGALLFTLVGGLIAILFQWAIVLLLAVGFVPFLQKYVSAIVLKMTTSFGDVLTYVHDGVRSAAIRTTVLRAFMWLHHHYAVENLIVVAHSLGTVIAYDVLNSRDFLSSVVSKDVSFVTFGSPLKKANLLLQLRRDEQRTSLGMMFACFSLLCALAALLCGMYGVGASDSRPFGAWQWGFTVATGIGAVALGMGAHARPVPLKILFLPYGLNLSRAQYVGIVLAIIASVILFMSTSLVWIVLAALVIVGFVAWAVPVSFSRFVYAHHAYRMSPFLGFGILFLVLLACAGLSDFLHPVACFLLAALVLSVMTGANPLEEFATENGRYARQMPKFSFDTPIRQWIDFWATHDLVAEFGLNDVHYSPTPHGPAEEIPVSRRVTNMRSFVADHTSYRHNLEQFIAPLTRMFLQELGFRESDSTSGQRQGPVASFLGHTPIRGTYEQDITTAMRTRSSRLCWLSRAGTMLLLTMLLFSPGVYRSIGEYIVFDERTPVSQTGTGEPAEGPDWFTAFYNPQPRVCGDILCRIRHIPILPNDVSETLIRNSVTGPAILHGLGYGVAFALSALLSRAFLLTPWKGWESALLDTLLQKQTSRSFNRLVRAAVFTFFALSTVALAVWVHLGRWSDRAGSAWLWNQDLTPAQTLLHLANWLLPPGMNVQSIIGWLWPW